MRLLFITLAAPVGIWLLSLLVEALRSVPRAPDVMPWDPDLKPRYVRVHDVTLRYVKAGTGPVLVLLHTLRTQLDLFTK